MSSTTTVSTSWLASNLYEKNTIVLDASMGVVGQEVNNASLQKQIPKSRFFDIKKNFSDTATEFPNTIPSQEQFTQEAQKLGISNNSFIVIYDNKGIYSSARAWWLFKAMGHSKVAVLDGGLRKWEEEGNEMESRKNFTGKKGDFDGKYNPLFIKTFDEIEALRRSGSHTILDARSISRFKGLENEPRKGLRSGNINGSVSLPFTEVLDGNKLRSKDELRSLFHSRMQSSKSMVFTCGSGITACILALAAETIGYDQLSVYDGSWTEYGTLTKE